MSLTQIDAKRMFGGWQKRFTHQSEITQCEMTFGIYLPPQVEQGQKVPVLYWLSGLTCNDENFTHKAGAQRLAAELGMAIVMPDTSPRGEGVPDDADGHWDFGLGAGFYVNATQSPWSTHYQMYDYVVNELPRLVEQHFAVTAVKSISGHSMGGHGALVIGLRNPHAYRSISAFAPISNPVNCPWGQKALGLYLGEDKDKWQQYDASILLSKATLCPPIKVNQGLADNFLAQELKPEALEDAAKQAGAEIDISYDKDYDHSYFYIASFIDEHLRFHAKAMAE